MTSLAGIFPIAVREFKVDAGICPKCRAKMNKRFEELRAVTSLYWTEETTKDYFTDNPPVRGQELLIHDTSGWGHTYALVTVDVPSHTNQKRIVISGYTNGYSGRSFYRSGKNCYAPKGQVTLLPYNAIIGDLIKKGNGRQIHLQPEEVERLLGK